MENWVDFKTIKAAISLRQVLAHYNLDYARIQRPSAGHVRLMYLVAE